VIDRDAAITYLRMIRRSIGRIATAAIVAETVATNEWAARMCSPERLRALREWSRTMEADDLSTLDLDEARTWAADADAVLSRLTGVA
jgi:hypothetical protein